MSSENLKGGDRLKVEIKATIESGRDVSFESHGESIEEVIENIIEDNGINNPEEPTELVRVTKVEDVELKNDYE